MSDSDPPDTIRTASPPRATPAGRYARGAVVDRYLVVGPLGAGGGGVVVKAYDPDLDRMVALKLLHPGPERDGETARARFLREARAAARLAHPNAVAVYDVGTVGEDVFVAMELVIGETLDAWLAPGRPLARVLDVFAQVGEALAAAHDRGLVHRDVKPSNVLVGADGRARVADFGLARVVGSADGVAGERVTDGAAIDLTRSGVVLGTPAYMAPEQHRGERVDGRADQFAFGATLYEAVCGQRPFDGNDLASLREAALAGRVRPFPDRARAPRWLRAAIARMLAVDPAGRYPSMRAVVHELRRDRRRRTAIAAAVVGTVALTSGVAWAASSDEVAAPCQAPGRHVAAMWNPVAKARLVAALTAAGERAAPAFAQRAAAAIDVYAADWIAMRRDACEATHVHGEQSAELLDRRMLCLDRALADTDALVARLSTHGGASTGGVAATAAVRVGSDAKGAADAHEAVKAVRDLPALADCADADRLLAEQPLPADLARRTAALALETELARVRTERRLGRHAAARALADSLAPRVAALGHAPIEAAHAYELGLALDSLAQYAAASAAYHRSAEAAARAKDDRTLARAWTRLLRLIEDRGGDAAAAAHVRPLVAAVVTRSADPEVIGLYETAESRLARKRGDYDTASMLAERAYARLAAVLAPDDPLLAQVLNDLGGVAHQRRDLVAALDFQERSLAIRRAAYGDDHPVTGVSYHNVALVLQGLGRYDEAIAHYERSLAIERAAHGDHHPGVAEVLSSIASLYFRTHRPAEAEPLMREVIAIRERTLGPQHDEVTKAIAGLAAVITEQGRHAEARTLLERALAIVEARDGQDSSRAEVPLANLGEVLQRLGDLDGAQHYCGRALAVIERHRGANHPNGALVRNCLAIIELERGRPAAAAVHMERAIAIHTARPGDPAQLADARALLARALWQQGSRARALAEARQAREGFVAAGTARAAALAKLDSWLAEHDVARAASAPKAPR